MSTPINGLQKLWNWVFGPTSEVRRETDHPRPYVRTQLTRRTPEYRVSHSIIDSRREYNSDSYAYNMCNSLARWAGTIEVTFDGPNAEYLKEKLAEWRPIPTAPQMDWNELIEYCYLRIVRDGNAIDEMIAVGGQALLNEINPAHLRDNAENLTVEGRRLGRIAQGVAVDDYGRPVGYVVNPVGTGNSNPLRPTRMRFIPAERVVHVFKRTQENSTVGSPLISRSLPAFNALRDLENELLASYQRSLTGGLLYRTPDHLLPVYLRDTDAQGDPVNPESTVTAEEDAAAALLKFTTTHEAVGDQVIPLDVEVQPRPVAELPDGASLDAVKGLLIQRAARGGDVTPYAVQGDFGTGGYLSSGFAVATDHRTYQSIQRLGLAYAKRVFEFWTVRMSANDSEFRSAMATAEYTFSPSKIPAANRAQEVMVTEKLINLGVISKAEAARMFGVDYDRMKAEIADEEPMEPENGIEPDLQQ